MHHISIFTSTGRMRQTKEKKFLMVQRVISDFHLGTQILSNSDFLKLQFAKKLKNRFAHKTKFNFAHNPASVPSTLPQLTRPLFYISWVVRIKWPSAPIATIGHYRPQSATIDSIGPTIGAIGLLSALLIASVRNRLGTYLNGFDYRSVQLF